MIKSGFENLIFIQKVQLYLLIPMFFWLLLFMIEKSFINENTNLSDIKSNIVTIEKNKIEKTVPSKIVRFIEEKLELYQVALKTVHIRKRLIHLEVRGSLENSLFFLKKLERHLDIISYRLLKEDDYAVINIVIDSEYFFNNDLLNEEFLHSKKIVNKKPSNIKIDAIVNKEVLLDGIWYQEGSAYQQYKIISIRKWFIKLKNIDTNKNFKVELLDESL